MFFLLTSRVILTGDVDWFNFESLLSVISEGIHQPVKVKTQNWSDIFRWKFEIVELLC